MPTGEGCDDALGDFLRRAERGLGRFPPGPGDPLANPRGCHDLDPDGVAVAPALPHRHAAVLVPVVASEAGLSLILTQRAAHLRDHSGQIAFPGGKIDEHDASPIDAAVREAREEIGLHPRFVRPLGFLDPYLSATAFLVTPVVALVERGASIRINPDEVADAFEVPLSVVMNPDLYEIRSHEWQGRTRHFYAIPFRDRLIWGVTAGIVRNLHDRLFR